MTVLWAPQALLADGWAESVRIEIAPDGYIQTVLTDQAPDGLQLGYLLPAPTNIHSHAFQRAMAGLTEHRGPDPRDSFWTWRQLMFQFLAHLTPNHVESITAYVQMEMLEAGYGGSVEFHYLHHQPDGAPYARLSEMSERIAAAADMSGMGLTLLPVHYQHGGCDKRPLGPGQIRFGNDFERYANLHSQAAEAIGGLPEDCRIGVAPHSLRATTAEDIHRASDLSPIAPIHIHLAEQTAEVDEVEACYGARPVDYFLDNFDAGSRWCAIHCTQMSPSELHRLARSGVVAGVCPLTEASLGDGIFDAVSWLGANGNLAIGSDSNIRISLTEELRTLEYTQRLRDHSRAALATSDRSTGRKLFDTITHGGALASGRKNGVIAPGHLADLVSIDATHINLTGRSGDALLDSYIFAGDDRLVTDVWSAGRHLVKDGEHIRRTEIQARYRQTLLELGDAM